MLSSKRFKPLSLALKTAEIRLQSLSALQSNEGQATTADLVLVGKKQTSIPVLKLNFADPESILTVTNHASHSSHSSHASHASHHSRHR